VTFTEVEIAVRETETAFTEMVTKSQAVAAAGNEVVYLQDRWDHLPDPNESAILLIEDLLDAQERLADEERDFVTAQTTYALSWVQLRKAMGILLRFDGSAPTCSIPVSQPAMDQESSEGVSIQGASLEAPRR
jgi:outer membrane protein TolC